MDNPFLTQNHLYFGATPRSNMFCVISGKNLRILKWAVRSPFIQKHSFLLQRDSKCVAQHLVVEVMRHMMHLGCTRENQSLPSLFHPCSSTGSHFSMLGIGDIVMPGLLLCFVLRYDNYKKQATGEVPGPGNMSGRMQRVSYFHCTLIGYFVGKQMINGQMM